MGIFLIRVVVRADCGFNGDLNRVLTPEISRISPGELNEKTMNEDKPCARG
jgi:hypothetical protein